MHSLTRVTGSKRTFLDVSDEETIEFINIVKDIAGNEEYQKLKNFTHHIGNTRYQHCLNVAWYSYLWAKHAGLNYRSAARGAMLHDFFLYDYHIKGQQPIPGRHAEVHPMVALSNAQKYFEVDDIMYDCIINHMYPITSVSPATKEGRIVSLADKYCASLELGLTGYRRISPLVERTIRAFSD